MPEIVDRITLTPSPYKGDGWGDALSVVVGETSPSGEVWDKDLRSNPNSDRQILS